MVMLAAVTQKIQALCKFYIKAPGLAWSKNDDVYFPTTTKDAYKEKKL